jgi:hypothetical protein
MSNPNIHKIPVKAKPNPPKMIEDTKPIRA